MIRFARMVQGPAAQLALCLVLAVLTRAFAFGDPVYGIDENWYLFVAERLASGDRLYTDIWDRKPPGLFAIYLAAYVFPDPLAAIQFMAGASAALTAFLVWRMAAKISHPLAGGISALFYLTLLTQLNGATGQSPVFYNLLIALAAYLVIFSPHILRKRRIAIGPALAMVAAGAAIIIKPTAGFEAAFLGLWASWRLVREASGETWANTARIALLAVLGALPALAVIACYVAMGRFEDFWSATVLSNFVKEAQAADALRYHRAFLAPLLLALPLGAMALSFLRAPATPFAPYRLPMGLWVLAALAGVLSVPNFYQHYFIPFAVPLSIAVAPFFSRSGLLVGLGYLAALTPLLESQPWNFGPTNVRKDQYARLAEAVRSRGEGAPLLVYDAPASLYSVAGTSPPSKLSFPNHLWDRLERNVSGIDTREEVARILAERPATVVMSAATSELATNLETRNLVEQYVRRCREVENFEILGWQPSPDIDLYTHCRSTS